MKPKVIIHFISTLSKITLKKHNSSLYLLLVTKTTILILKIHTWNKSFHRKKVIFTINVKVKLQALNHFQTIPRLFKNDFIKYSIYIERWNNITTCTIFLKQNSAFRIQKLMDLLSLNFSPASSLQFVQFFTQILSMHCSLGR